MAVVLILFLLFHASTEKYLQKGFFFLLKRDKNVAAKEVHASLS